MAETLEMIIAAYNNQKGAGNIFPQLQKMHNRGEIQVVAGAQIVKDTQGKTAVLSALEVAKKKGTRYGAIAGGLIAVLAPPVGIAGVLVGAAAGAAVGRKAKKKPTKDVSTHLIKQVESSLSPDSSAIIIICEETQTEAIMAAFGQLGGEVLHSPLSQNAVENLLRSIDEKETGELLPISDEERAAGDQLKAQLRDKTRRIGPVFANALVIINPASGQDEPILNTLNTIFRAGGLDWDAKITKKAGDATRLAREAAESGFDIVAVYGGDGSVMEAAAGLAGTNTPLAILPGGTNNVMSVELRVPRPLADAAALITSAPAEIRKVDMGRANDHNFILRVGFGYEAVINETADRAMKDRYGGLAYSLAGIKALKTPPIAHYRLTMDGGQVEELDGLWLMVANSTSMGSEKLNLVQKTSVSDGLLDVIVVRQADLDSLLNVLTSMANIERIGEPLPHWQVTEVSIEADPPMSVTGDGEIWENTPYKCSVIPGAVNILVPASLETAES